MDTPEIGSYSGVSAWLVCVPSFLPASAPAWVAGFSLISDDTPHAAGVPVGFWAFCNAKFPF